MTKLEATETQRVAVRGRFRGGSHGDIAAAAREILHVELLPENSSELLRDETRGGVVGAAGADRDDDLDGLGRVSLRTGDPRDRRDRDCGGCKAEELATNEFHRV